MLKTKFAKIGALALGVTFALSLSVNTAGAVTVAELQAQINALMAQLASLQGTATVSANFTSDLTIGSTGSQVVALQQMLVAQGHLVMPSGVAMGYFGSLTKAAVMKWQAANGVSATGYFGPLSRAKANSMGGATGTVPGTTIGGGTTVGGSISTPGVEGTLTVTETSTGVESELSEGESKVPVIGLEIEAELSDIRIERIEVDLGANRDIERNIADRIFVMDGSTVLASKDLDSSTVIENSSGRYVVTISGLNFIVREGTEEVLTIALDALDNIDTADETTYTVRIPADGVRGVDGAGINLYDPATLFEATFTVEGVTGGDLDLSEGDDNPVSEVVFIDETENTDGVLMLQFELEADEQDITVDAIPVGFTATTDDVDGMVRTAILKRGTTVLDTVTIPTSATTFYLATFDDLDLEVEDGDSVELSVYVDLNDADVTTFATGTTLYATTTASDSGWDVEDALGDAVTVDGGTVTGGTATFQTEGVAVTAVSTSATATNLDTAANSYGTYTIKFKVTATEDDAYIYNGAATTSIGATVGVLYDITGTTWPGGTESAVITSGADTSGSYFVVSEGTSEEFTLTVTLNPSSSGTYALELEAVGSADAAETAEVTSTVDQNDQSFETNPVYVSS